MVNFLYDLNGMSDFSPRTPVLHMMLKSFRNEEEETEEQENDPIRKLEKYQYEFLFEDMSSDKESDLEVTV